MQIQDLSLLKRLDRNAYNYFYHQTKCDLINNNIEELEYSQKYKNQFAGLCVTCMYVEMLETEKSIDYFLKNYKKYMPKNHVKKHAVFIKQRITDALDNIKNNCTLDVYYVKQTFLESIRTLAPTYFIEIYKGEAPCLPEEDFVTPMCPVDIQVSVKDGLSIYYTYKKILKPVLKLEDIYAITVDADVVNFQTNNHTEGLTLRIADPQVLASFVSCLNGYYRLTSKWNVDLCESYPSPSLAYLKKLKCHGPIGAENSYAKLRTHDNFPGSCIMRQCEKDYDTYYIDIIVKTQPETFKLTHEYRMWHLSQPEKDVATANNINELVKNISKDLQVYRMGPSEYGMSFLFFVLFIYKTFKLKFIPL